MRRHIALRLLGLASRILPASRREWLRDMQCELEYVKSDRVALDWALGCVWASLWERANAMLNSNGQISKWVLALEWLMCFVPLTLLWGVAIAFLLRYENAPLDIVVATVAGSLGPIALIVSMGATFFEWGAKLGKIARLLTAGFAFLTILQLVNVFVRLKLSWFDLDGSIIVLLNVLPLLGCLHLAHLSRESNAVA